MRHERREFERGPLIGSSGEHMKRYLLICLSALWVTTTVAYAEPLTMAGKNLRQAISGRTVFLATPVGAVPIRYRRNGTMLGSARGLIAQVTGSKSDKGRWWIIGNRLCQRWSQVDEGALLLLYDAPAGTKDRTLEPQ